MHVMWLMAVATPRFGQGRIPSSLKVAAKDCRPIRLLKVYYLTKRLRFHAHHAMESCLIARAHLLHKCPFMLLIVRQDRVATTVPYLIGSYIIYT